MAHPRWPLATKLVFIGLVLLLLALASIGLTLTVTWKLEGGAAAVNEAGRLRMLSYRLALQGPELSQAERFAQVTAIDAGLEGLRNGDPARPLAVPWDDTTQQRFDTVTQGWNSLRRLWMHEAQVAAGQPASQGADTVPGGPLALTRLDSFVGSIDALVSAIEGQLARWTSLLNGVQLAMLGLAVAGAVSLVYAGYLLVVAPLARLRDGLAAAEGGDLGARVAVGRSDEFGQLAEGFNRMAEKLQSAYATLEDRVQEKTTRLQEKTERLATLYEVSAAIGRATRLDVLAQDFARAVRRVARADACAVRWADDHQQRHILLGADCLPEGFAQAEQCVHAGQCECAQVRGDLHVVRVLGRDDLPLGHCARAGYQNIVAVPIRLGERHLGEVGLFFHGEPDLSAEDRSLLEALARHLASAFEGLRAAAMDREAAVAQERTLLAQELHDSIAQSLAFMKIQVGLLRAAVQRGDAPALAQVLDELDAGVRESYGDVRELLLHFRTRTDAQDIEHALRTTLTKFEHHSGLRARLSMTGQGLPLDADVQVQVLHVVQEALSNVRKHARASQVWVEVQQSPRWRFEVRDDGIGLPPSAAPDDETHVGLRIMRERAGRIGATVAVQPNHPRGTRVTLTLPPPRTPAATGQGEALAA